MEQKDNNLEQRLRKLGNIPVPDSLLKDIQTRLGQLTPEWATRQYQLGRESRKLGKGDRGKNLVMAIAHFQNALHVYTSEVYPLQRVEILYELGCVYCDLSHLPGKDRLTNLAVAVTRYREALNLVKERHLADEWITKLNQAISKCDRQRSGALKYRTGVAKAITAILRLHGQRDSAAPKKTVPESGGRGYPLLSKKPEGTSRSFFEPRWFAIAMIMLVGVVIFFFLTAQAAPLSLRQSLKFPRSGATWVHAVSWSPNGKYIAVLWDDSTMQVLDAETQKEIFSQEAGWGYGLSWSPDSQALASVGKENNTIQVWDISTRQSRIYTKHTALIEAIAWSPKGSSIASASDDRTIQIWNADSMEQLISSQYPSGSQVNAIAWSPDGKFLVSGDDDGRVWTWDARTGKHLESDRGHKGPITSVSWSADGHSIASSSYDGTVQIWNGTMGAPDLTFSPSNGSPVFAAIWSPQKSSNFLALTCYDGSVQVWNQWGNEVATYGEGQPNGIFTISWSPQGDQLVTGGQGKILAFKLRN